MIPHSTITLLRRNDPALKGFHFFNRSNVLLYSNLRDFFRALKFNTNFLTLDLSRTVDAEALRYLADALEVNNTVEYIRLHENRGLVAVVGPVRGPIDNLPSHSVAFGEEGAIVLAEILMTNTTVNHLVLTDNAIGPVGAAALARALKVNKTLKILDLRDLSIGSQGLISLSEGFGLNKTLSNLTLTIGPYFEPGVKAFEDALRRNNSLESLCLIPTFYTDDFRSFERAVQGILECNLSLKEIKMDIRSIGSAALRENRNLEKFVEPKIAEGVLPAALAKSRRPSVVYYCLQYHVDLIVRGLQSRG